MYIKNVIIDGFKSYGRRTEIDGFDKEFNAITGLNGTGKSNILDAICFVLGISNLTQVRAQSMQDLVYKSGQAGVTKATVTINFDNSNKNQCPIGYENCREIAVARQIVVGGKGKYLINGKNAQAKQIQDLFCSVQLNIHNPNFLIMQGRITKVLNMKPPEILSMIEEAAGTSMYENKKEKSMSLIQKKDNKLDELRNLINDEIHPKLEKLRKDQQQYQEYQKVCRDIEYLTRIHISFKYLQCMKNVENCESKIQKLTEDIENNQETVVKNLEEIKEIEEKIAEIQGVLNATNSADMKELEKELEDLNHRDAKLKASVNVMQEQIISEKRKLKTLQKNVTIDEKALTTKEEQMNKAGGAFEKLKQDEADDLKAYQDAQKRVEAVNLGLALNDEGEATSLQDQLTTAKSKIADCTSTIKQSEMELKYSQQSLATKEKGLKSNDSAYLKDKDVISKTEKEIKNFEHQLAGVSYQDGALEELVAKRDGLNKECRAIRTEIDRHAKFDFRYDDPIPSWDARRVKGVVASLFRMKDQKYSRALSSVIGGSWRSVVTDNDETGKLLLERGNLQTRTTIIPMTKISSRTLDQRVVNLAQKLVGKENAIPAIDLIEYEREVEPAMKFLFGGAFVCKDLETAKRVTYDKNIRTRSFTLDGDHMDPDGSLTGGAVQQGLPILEEAARYNQLKRELDEKTRELNEITRKLAGIQQSAEQFKAVKDKLENCQMQLRTAKERIMSTTFQQGQDEIKELKEKVAKLQETITECIQTKKLNEEKVKDLSSKLTDSKGHRDRELKAADINLKNTKQKYDQSRSNWQKREQECETLTLEIEELKKTIVEGQEQVAAIEKQTENLQKQVDETSNSDGDLKKRSEELREAIKTQKDAIAAQNKEVRAKTSRKEKLLKSNSDLELEIKKKENEITKVRADNADGFNRIKGLEETYPWIPEDKEHFGARNTRYDYTKEDPNEAGRKLHKMQDTKEKLSRNINQEAMVLLEKEEEHYKKIMERRTKIENDRKKIIDSIKNMDTKKVEDLKLAWEQVNANFGSIFSTLLPGAQSKLMPPEGAKEGFLKGLEVKVGFNGIWKESLTELSGGQRSLVALSLILAMLKYKPAPLYILDEVDAALDLSHTQNIGSMLKAHFKNSQFVIVSLKDGMFNNANVLFRTKFVDGVSGVVRTVNRSQ